ncbi:MAG: hypothetical protein COZ06_19880 [Armatimonadetes bacterium CG_4_10_14_3_um_filter_66_18]|nr:hypothetical protein [Armatimonadota bacterium]OIP09860.1 MAG: hypothetical protein AUJ96_04490 [Armatimonadetes bacterium CG2_30_66_41]PIU94324.1 MAG: hypothetical protein COS65_08230 [Armatimonadetes bacterium CG06_land_8_20_14_3_00_66_21]PIX40889.1 MAG: hypothetical protein COZ57_24825 [Armatimonadetes bacterium CG_4_8_14_3_um_filter_66_20]PIY44725.1 MAG: hypothetical protein COZ06_19880 [Armatimonadetes bacterium CG_4_10_14_3_um_filter_66_18]PJB60382.1 MAG: hypothetical protein CO096_34
MRDSAGTAAAIGLVAVLSGAAAAPIAFDHTGRDFALVQRPLNCLHGPHGDLFGLPSQRFSPRVLQQVSRLLLLMFAAASLALFRTAGAPAARRQPRGLWFWTGPWRWLRWLLVIMVLAYGGPSLLVVLIGVCLLSVAWPLKGVRTSVPLPPLREAMAPSPPSEGVIRYREWP